MSDRRGGAECCWYVLWGGRSFYMRDHHNDRSKKNPTWESPQPGRQNLLTKLRHRRTERIHSTFFYASITHLNCYRFIQTSIRVHRQAIQRVHAYLSTSCTQRRLYNIHMHISYFEVQFCLPTNVECSYMCCTHRLYFIILSIHDIRCECRRSTLFIMQKFKLP